MAPDIEAVAEQVFVALADPTRRTILAALATDGPSTATDLAARLPITRQAIAKHLALMTDAGLVTPEPGERRRVRYRLRSAPVQLAQQFLAALANAWDDRLDALQRYLRRHNGTDAAANSDAADDEGRSTALAAVRRRRVASQSNGLRARRRAPARSDIAAWLAAVGDSSGRSPVHLRLAFQSSKRRDVPERRLCGAVRRLDELGFAALSKRDRSAELARRQRTLIADDDPFCERELSPVMVLDR